MVFGCIILNYHVVFDAVCLHGAIMQVCLYAHLYINRYINNRVRTTPAPLSYNTILYYTSHAGESHAPTEQKPSLSLLRFCVLSLSGRALSRTDAYAR